MNHDAKECLATQGYCVLHNILSASEIAALRCAIEDTVERVARVLRTPYAISHPKIGLEERFDRIASEDQSYSIALYQAAMADTHRDPRVTALISHPILRRHIAELLSPLTRTGEVIRPRAAIPAYEAHRSPWHQDVVDPRDARDDLDSVRLACWMPLNDVTAGGGALEVSPGAWQRPLPHARDAHGHMSIPDSDIPASGRRCIPVTHGDLLVLDRYIPHRAGPIRPDRGRWAFTMWVKAKRVLS